MTVLLSMCLPTMLSAVALKCAIQPHAAALSANGQFKAIVRHEGTFELRHRYSKGWKSMRKGSFQSYGHHRTVFVTDKGDRIVTTDPYASVVIYDGNGKVRKVIAPESVLSTDELRNRPHQWTCHPEGEWLKESRLEGRLLVLTLYTGKQLRIST